jgi:hypothetical protein
MSLFVVMHYNNGTEMGFSAVEKGRLPGACPASRRPAGPVRLPAWSPCPPGIRAYAPIIMGFGGEIRA